MSVYTLLNESQLTEMLDDYDLPALISYEEISDGIENSNYLLHCHGQDFVLTIFEQKTPEELLPFFSFMALALSEGFPVPAPIQNRQGAVLNYFMHSQQLRHFIICPRLLGSHPNSVSKEVCFEVGHMFARLHKLTSSKKSKIALAKETLGFIFPNELQHQTLNKFLGKEKFRIYQEEKEYLSKRLSTLSSLPSGVCHCDFFPDNMLTTEHLGKLEVSGLLDWYDAKHTTFIYDLAVISLSWSSQFNNENKALLNTTVHNALLKGYQHIRPLSSQEQLAWPLCLRFAAFRFWISRELYQYKMSKETKSNKSKNRKDPDEFWNILVQLRSSD